ncbi:hypothetical protein ACGF07_25555 [Kitasatospora sp. NPDC048194]|uniref:hypothetical protein n=1 Tax=Kitasatospora sp. NPDC048194 TaxID=3364045 RepID=UPI003714A612
MAMTVIAHHPTANGGTVTTLWDDEGRQGYQCTGCTNLVLDADDQAARDHAAACGK